MQLIGQPVDKARAKAAPGRLPRNRTAHFCPNGLERLRLFIGRQHDRDAPGGGGRVKHPTKPVRGYACEMAS
jgi:hypothetical protein